MNVSGYCTKCKTFHSIEPGFNESRHFAYCPKCSKALKLQNHSLETTKKQLSLFKDEIGEIASFKPIPSK